jgi:16S rRNA (cytosine1402-N4)-methyltransferase
VTEFAHTTVMLREAVDAVQPQPGRVYVDATLGGGGHSEALLEAGGTVYACDRDPEALAAASKRLARFGERAVLLHAPFSELRERLAEHGVARVHGLVADLGVSSPQLDNAERGFSFARAGDLDMRMDPTSGLTLRELLATLDDKALADAIYELGDERRSRPIARSIKAAEARGELGSTDDLRRAIVRVTGPRRGGIDPATRTFQALRMLVNGELTELKVLLEALGELLEDGARAAIISFHSGEDRLVKHAFRDDPRLEVVTKRPLEASEQERTDNPRARSAKLRVAQRIERGGGMCTS